MHILYFIFVHVISGSLKLCPKLHSFCAVYKKNLAAIKSGWRPGNEFTMIVKIHNFNLPCRPMTFHPHQFQTESRNVGSLFSAKNNQMYIAHASLSEVPFVS